MGELHGAGSRDSAGHRDVPRGSYPAAGGFVSGLFGGPGPGLSADAPDHRDLGKAAGGIGPEISLPRVCPQAPTAL